MTDVLKIALERRSKLEDEIAKLDEFIRMAETLIRTTGSAATAMQGSSAAAPSSIPATALSHSIGGDMEASARPAPRRPAEAMASDPADVPRPSIIRRGLAAS